MIERGAARLVTGPLAFLVAGIVDLTAFTAQALARYLRRRLA
jgi:hypothetical protein